MNTQDTALWYFLGIGGIGMSALARHLHQSGQTVMGYDKVASALTTQLELEGIPVGFVDNPAELPQLMHSLDRSRVKVVYTPAIPADSRLKNWFSEKGYELLKRSELLGHLTNGKRLAAVAGTHGKTTTSALAAHLLHDSKMGCNAFLGGIAANYGTNHLYDGVDKWYVAEADEFDRSFLTLSPTVAVITSTDADHLDIYHAHDDLRAAFAQFAKRVEQGGLLLLCDRIDQDIVVEGVRVRSYGFSEQADYQVGYHVDTPNTFDLRLPNRSILKALPAPMPGRHNLENTAAAVAIALEVGVPEEQLRAALSGFRGIKRRFEYQSGTGSTIFIDDYAHHPEELRATISAVRERHPGKHITGIFQPHLFSRTRDFADRFAESLSMLDEVYLLDIYPAREKPIPGIDSQWLLDKISNPSKKHIDKSQLLPLIREHVPEVLLTLGAGDIDREVEPLRRLLASLNHEEEANR